MLEHLEALRRCSAHTLLPAWLFVTQRERCPSTAGTPSARAGFSAALQRLGRCARPPCCSHCSQTNAAPLPCRFFFQGAGDWADALVGQLGAHADSLLPLAAHQADAMLADAARVSFTGAALLCLRAHACRFVASSIA